MKEVKYPGKAIKISWWDKLVNWWWNFRYPMRVGKPFNAEEWIRPNKEVVDRIYNQLIEKQRLSFMPPIYAGSIPAAPDGHVEVRTRRDREGCHTANGVLICGCGKCKVEDFN